MSEPIVSPAKFLAQHELPSDLAGCTTAILGFCRFNAMKERLSAKPLGRRYFSHVDEAHQFAAMVAGRPIVAVDCLYGGPMSATVLEELAHYGIRNAVGYGYAGSLTHELPVGRVLFAEQAIVSDGTSREYLPEAKAVAPEPYLSTCLQEEAARAGIPLVAGTVWTTDAIYREYPDKVAKWRQPGAHAGNMDTGHFYAVSQVVGLASTYACVISDCVEGPAWEDGFDRIRQATESLQELMMATAVRLAMSEA
jgi:uridine phosphorylase